MRQETVPKDLEPSPLPGLVLNTFWGYSTSQSQSSSNSRQVLQLQHARTPHPQIHHAGLWLQPTFVLFLLPSMPFPFVDLI